jgi:hypothetical protein
MSIRAPYRGDGGVNFERVQRWEATTDRNFALGLRAMTALEPSPTPGTPQERLTKVVFFGIIALGLVPLGISWFFDQRYDTDGWNRLFAVSASFAASAVWWALLARYAERELRALARETLAFEQARSDDSRERERARFFQTLDESDKVRRDEIEILRAELERTTAPLADELPSGIYTGKNGPDIRFNRDLERDLEATSEYDFQGPTAVYVGARLALRQNTDKLQFVQVKITDINESAAVRHAVDDRFNRPEHRAKTREQVESELRDDVYMAIIGLFDARHRSQRILVVHDRRAARIRTERFDAGLYEAVLNTREHRNFTVTRRWSADQENYKGRKDALHAAMRDFSMSVSFTSAKQEDDLLAHLQKLGMAAERLPELRATYRERYIEPHRRVLTAVARYTDELADA